MQILSVLMMMSLIVGALGVVWACYDLYRKLAMRSALVRSLATDPEFVHDAPHVWECDWRDQCDDERFKRLRAIIRNHIQLLHLPWPADVLWPLDQPHLMNRYRYVRSLVREVEQHLSH